MQLNFNKNRNDFLIVIIKFTNFQNSCENGRKNEDDQVVTTCSFLFNPSSLLLMKNKQRI